MESISSLFASIHQQAVTNTPYSNARQRLDTVKIRALGGGAQAKQYTEAYKQQENVPAFYDANDHIIHLNHRLLSGLKSETSALICYHELIHAASHHAADESDGSTTLWSGIRIELFNRAGRRTRVYNHLLNEGVVQAFAVEALGLEHEDYAYRREVGVAHRLIESVGYRTVADALFAGRYDQLEHRFAAAHSNAAITELGTLVDSREYDAAEAWLDGRTEKAQLGVTTSTFAPSVAMV